MLWIGIDVEAVRCAGLRDRVGSRRDVGQRQLGAVRALLADGWIDVEARAGEGVSVLVLSRDRQRADCRRVRSVLDREGVAPFGDGDLLRFDAGVAVWSLRFSEGVVTRGEHHRYEARAFGVADWISPVEGVARAGQCVVVGVGGVDVNLDRRRLSRGDLFGRRFSRLLDASVSAHVARDIAAGVCACIACGIP